MNLKQLLKSKAFIVGVVLIVLIVFFSASARAALFSNVTQSDYYVDAYDGAKIHVTVFKSVGASGKLPTILVVHGLGQSSESMNAISTELARHGILVVAMDYRGHGDSEGGINYIGEPLMAPNISNDLFAVYSWIAERDDVDLTKFGVIGHSMGSRAALRFALFNPTVSALILIGPYYVWESTVVNSTYPSANVLLLVGENDIITPPELAYELFRKLTDYKGEVGKTFGTFENKTARKLVEIEGVDHYTILYNKEALSEILGWVYDSFGLEGEPNVIVDPSVAGTGVFVSYFVLAFTFVLMFMVFKALESRFKLGVEVRLELPLWIKILVIAVVLILYYLIAYYTFPLIVEKGWESYQFFKMSGAQYTFYYFIYLLTPFAIALVITGIALFALKKITKETLIPRVVGGLLIGVIEAVVVFIWIFIGFNLAFTGLTGDYMPTLQRWGIFFFYIVLLFPLMLVDEIIFRYLVQEMMPIENRYGKIAATSVVQYLVRILPFLAWLAIAVNTPLLVSVISQYYSAGLIENMTIVIAFLPMNAYGLFYAFYSAELFHAPIGSYLYDRTKNVLASALVRTLMLAFTLSAVLALL